MFGTFVQIKCFLLAYCYHRYQCIKLFLEIELIFFLQIHASKAIKPYRFYVLISIFT